MLSLVIALLVTLTYVQIQVQQKIFKGELNLRETLMREKTLQQGQSLADNLAHQVAIEIAAFNFSKLTELINTAVKEDDELVYGILMDAERVAYLHTQSPQLELEILSTPDALFAITQQQPSQQILLQEGAEIVEFITPIQVSTQPWGVLRLGFSMANVASEITQAHQEINIQIREMLIQSIVTAILFLIPGFIIIFIASAKITKPLVKLTEAAGELANGNFATKIPLQKIKYGDEVNVLAIAFANMVVNLERSYKKLEQHNRAYEKFVPHQFLSLLDKQSIIDINLGDQVEKELTVLFSDIRDFTAQSETLTPQENFDFINTYLGQMEPIIHQHHGFIDKYIGDAIMALFPTRADDAVCGSIAMLKTLMQYNKILQKAGFQALQIGIGLHTGPLMLGIVGGQNRMDGTVIADGVNLASRVENLTKVYNTPLLITEQTYLNLDEPLNYQIRVIDAVRVKGKSEVVTIYEVYDADFPENIALKNETKENFELGFVLYHSGEIIDSKENFKKVFDVNKKDKAAQVYLERCNHFQRSKITGSIPQRP
jgi:class 3 adenylate cyclase/HAMP domain-containing protein